MLLKTRTLWGLGIAGAGLGIMACFAVLAFHFPAYLTTPMLRDVYEEHQVRFLLELGLYTGYIFSLLALLFGPDKKAPCLGLILLTAAWAMGGTRVSVSSPIPRSSPYLSVDWVILDLLLLTILFVPLERLFKRKLDQPINRAGWKTDLTYYIVNHVFMGALVLLIHFPSQALMQYLDADEIRAFVASWPLGLQVIALACLGELMQYWIHRWHHEIPWLWRFHRIHHSSKAMDWLAGSRLHMIDVLLTRSLTVTPIMLLGFSPQAINLWLPILALQSVFIHCNVHWRFLPLRGWIGTPLYHHWHHADEPEAINKNYAISLTFMDRIFGTYYCPDRWPQAYGIHGDELADGFWHQLWSPFASPSTQKDKS